MGEPLRAQGHDVLALQERPDLDGLSDKAVLELAITEQRILVTCNGKHFVPLLAALAGAQRTHAGCIVLWRVQHRHHGTILETIATALARYPNPGDWVDRVASG